VTVFTVLVSGAPAALADTIHVTPDSARPGQRIHLSVPGCGAGASPHSATSTAFTQAITLYGKSDTGEGDATIRAGLSPGTYPISAKCDATHVVRGQILVAGNGGRAPQPSATPAKPAGGSGAGYWVLGAVAFLVAIGATVVFARNRSD
jgi:hypothetical protein